MDDSIEEKKKYVRAFSTSSLKKNVYINVTMYTCIVIYYYIYVCVCIYLSLS